MVDTFELKLCSGASPCVEDMLPLKVELEMALGHISQLSDEAKL